MHTLLKYVYQFVTLYNLNSLRTLKLALCHAVTLQWYWAPKIRKFCGMLEPGFGIRRFRFHYMFFWRRKWQPIPVSLPGESHGQRNLAGYTPCGCKELDMTEHKIYLTSSSPFEWRRKRQSTPVFLPGKTHGQSSLASYGPLGHQELDMTE